MTEICAAILGASGYTGVELLRWLQHHPKVAITALSANSQAGKSLGEVFPHLAQDTHLPTLQTIEEINFSGIDVVFCCLPHATTQKTLAELPEHIKVIDLSADFRLHDLGAYEQWYGHPHEAPELQKEAVYGLSEHARAQIAKTRLVANPGCYPTASLLALLPLLKAALINPQRITIDAMSGVTGAGRSVAQRLLFCEVNEGAGAYGVGGHRHVAEMEQEVCNASGVSDTILSFTPHLVPMQRGISATIHAELAGDATFEQAEAALKEAYEKEAFVHVVKDIPTTHQVRGTNNCHIAIRKDRRAGSIILTSVIDNLIKGASGQAIQNMNIAYGLEETLGLQARAVFP